MIEGRFGKYLNKTKLYNVADTNLTSRQMHYLHQKSILILKHHDYFTYRFSFAELLWLRLVTELREMTISFETIKKIKDELFKTTELSEYISDPKFRIYLNMALDETELTELEISEIMADENLIKKYLNLKISYFDRIINQLLVEKNRISLIIAIKKREYGTEINRSNSPYWLTIFSPEKIIDHSKEKDYFEIFNHKNISIPLNDLLQDIIYSIDYKKLPKNLIQLSDSEQFLIDHIRSGDYKSISIRFNDNKQPYLAELTEIKKLKAETRLYEIIHKGAYEDIEIKTQNGEIYSFKSTKKVKLN